MLRSSFSLNSVFLKQSVFYGEYRDIIRWIRYFEDRESFFYLLDPFDPDLVQPNSYYALREVEAASEMEQIQRFSIQQDAWDHIVAVMDWYDDREFIANMPAGLQNESLPCNCL